MTFIEDFDKVFLNDLLIKRKGWQFKMENKNTMKDKSLQWLVIHAQKGTPDAFEELYHRTCQKQYYYARMLLHDAFLAEDIVQEVFIKLYKRIGYIKEPDAFNGYLSRMTYNECMHYRRKKYLDTETCVEQEYLNSFEDKITLLSPESSLLSVEKSKLLAEGLKTLSEEERFSLMMYAYENMNIDTIGKAMKLSRSTVKRRIASAKEKMVRYLSLRDMRGLIFAPILLSDAVQESILKEVLSQKENTERKTEFSLKTKIIILCSIFILSTGLLLVPAAINTLLSQNAPSHAANAPSTTPIGITPPLAPTVVSFDNDDTTLTITLKAGDFPINFDSIYTLSPDGQKITPLSADPAAGTATFILPTSPMTLYVTDTKGLTTTAPITEYQ